MKPHLPRGLLADVTMRGHFHFIPIERQILTPANLSTLTGPAPSAQNSESAGVQVPSAAAGGPPEAQAAAAANSGLREIKVPNE